MDLEQKFRNEKSAQTHLQQRNEATLQDNYHLQNELNEFKELHKAQEYKMKAMGQELAQMLRKKEEVEKQNQFYQDEIDSQNQSLSNLEEQFKMIKRENQKL